MCVGEGNKFGRVLIGRVFVIVQQSAFVCPLCCTAVSLFCVYLLCRFGWRVDALHSGLAGVVTGRERCTISHCLASMVHERENITLKPVSFVQRPPPFRFSHAPFSRKPGVDCPGMTRFSELSGRTYSRYMRTATSVSTFVCTTLCEGVFIHCVRRNSTRPAEWWPAYFQRALQSNFWNSRDPTYNLVRRSCH